MGTEVMGRMRISSSLRRRKTYVRWSKSSFSITRRTLCPPIRYMATGYLGASGSRYPHHWHSYAAPFAKQRCLL
ncbi:hypothetical protein C8Q79DRAFT_245969 [Trametes meyenii]|nr:hypothetical protein C8Q79DRAFT_245969 [Trametes meyenii]